MRKVKYIVQNTREYDRDLRKIFRKDKDLFIKIEEVVVRMSKDPFSVSLRTHLVNVPSVGKIYSSRVTGDIRVLWVLSNGMTIVLYRVGGHSKVYR